MSFQIRIDVDTSEVDRDLLRVGEGPDMRHRRRFDATLTKQFQDTQLRVHVITGSLKASGRFRSNGRLGGGWEGTIVYGQWPLASAPVPGPPRNPMHYARYEYEKPTDERYDHNFFRGILDGDDGYVDTILDFLRGGPS